MHERAHELARERGVSLSAMIADLTIRGLAQIDTPVRLERNEITGLPTLSIGRRITSEDVTRLIDEDA